MKKVSCKISISLSITAIAVLLCLAACGPPAATKDAAYGVWLGTSGAKNERVLITFIAPDKVELEYPDAKEKKGVSGKWSIIDGGVKVSLSDSEMLLKLSHVEVNDEKKERLSNSDGSFVVTKV